MKTSDPESNLNRADPPAEIFARALELDGPAREAFLEAHCAGDNALLEELRSMIREHGIVGDFLGPRTSADDAKRSRSQGAMGPLPGETIDRYHLLDVIGEGGFGVVYLAEQREPVRREVALKVIKLGMDTRQVIARFEAERQALAIMDHPGIARVFDAGSTETGRPFFVMELVRGKPITDYCDSQQLDTRARLELFVKVCLAVQHAHQKGIIHRDIKPSNVLVSVQDDVAVPKVIDFGIAKATNAEQTERTILTEQRQIIGTPAYMSPEQAGMDGSDIDTRSDIYGLGVLLYELLTGGTPFDSKKLQCASFDEMMRIIREEEPVKPSTRFSTLGDTGTQVAERRQTDTRKLRTILRGDLDWIAMKCLEKDRSRRYATAAALAEDIQRFLTDKPIEAAAPSKAYRLRKFARRYRGPVVAGALMVCILIAATAVSIGFAWRESAARQREQIALAREIDQRERADRETIEARRQANAAESARELSEKRAEETKQVAGFQANMLRGIDAGVLGHGIRDEFREQVRLGLERERIDGQSNGLPRTPVEVDAGLTAFDASAGLVQGADFARRVMDKYILASAAETVQRQFGEQPLVQAEIRDALGAAYRALGLYDSAEGQYRESLSIRRSELGSKHIGVAESLNNVATVLFHKGDFSEAESLCVEALAMQRGMAPDAEIASTLHNLGTLAQRAGDLGKAEEHYREALELARGTGRGQSDELASVLDDLAGLLYHKGDLKASEAAYRQALDLRRKSRGDDHSDVANTLQNLAQVLRDGGDISGAESMYRSALEIQRRCLGNEHEDVARIMSNLASLLKAKGAGAEAEPLYRESLAIFRRVLGNLHPEIANTLNNLAVLLRDRGDYSAAEPLYREAIAILEKTLPAGHILTATSRSGLGRLLMIFSADASISAPVRDARLDEAESLLLSAEQDFRNAPNNPALMAKQKRLFEWLVELYEVRNAHAGDERYNQQVATWKAALEQIKAAP